MLRCHYETSFQYYVFPFLYSWVSPLSQVIVRPFAQWWNFFIWRLFSPPSSFSNLRFWFSCPPFGDALTSLSIVCDFPSGWSHNLSCVIVPNGNRIGRRGGICDDVAFVAIGSCFSSLKFSFHSSLDASLQFTMEWFGSSAHFATFP